MIDPGIWTDDGMAELTARQQLLYIGLFSNADDEGRVKGSPRAIRLMLPVVYLGATDAEVASDLDAVLGTMRGLARYEVAGRPYLAFRTYARWQKISHPSASVLPPPVDAPVNPPELATTTAQPSVRPPEDSRNVPGTGAERSAPVEFKRRGDSLPSGERPAPPARPVQLLPDDDAPQPAAADPPPEESGASNERQPPSGPLHALVAAYCLAAGIAQPASYGNALGQAKALQRVGIAAEEVARLYGWAKAQPWVKQGADLGTLVVVAERWLAAGRPGAGAVESPADAAEAERRRRFSAALRRDPKAADLPGKPVLY